MVRDRLRLSAAAIAFGVASLTTTLLANMTWQDFITNHIDDICETESAAECEQALRYGITQGGIAGIFSAVLGGLAGAGFAGGVVITTAQPPRRKENEGPEAPGFGAQ